MKIESKTAKESWLITNSVRMENYKKSFDAIMAYMLKEINKAANQGDFSVRIRIAPLEKFICNSDSDSILDDVERILSNGSLLKGNTKSDVQMVDGLGYIIEKTPTEWNIKWEEPMESPFDINIPYPEMGQEPSNPVM